MKNTIFLLCLIAVGCGSPAEQPASAPPNNKWSDARMASVLEAQDHRDTKSLLVLLTDTSAAVREAAAMAFASVQDSTAHDALITALHDKTASVHQAAARAMSFIADTTLAKSLAEKALKETSAEAATSMYAASFRALVRSKPDQDPQVLFAAYTKSTGYQRACIADALRRVPKERIAPHEPRYVELLEREREPYVKVLLIAGLKNFSDVRATKAAAELVSDPDPMIRVAALRAHATITGQGAMPELFQAVQDSFPAVRSTAVDLLKTMDNPGGKACLQAGQKTTDPMVKIPLYGLAAGFGTGVTRDRAKAELESLWAKENDPYTRAALIEAKARFVPVDTLIFWMEQSWPAVERQAALAGALEQIDHTSPSLQKPQRNKVLKAAFNTNDPGLIAAGSEALSTSDAQAIAMVLDSTVEQQMRSVLHPIRDLETLQLLDVAIAKRNGLPTPVHQAPLFNHPIDLARLANLEEGRKYRITTSKGEIVIAIEPNVAPGTCVAFDSIVSSGYYNGKSFHRIVPNFVAQGGCPRGDGFGAMDWTLRTEIGDAGFVAGAVGMASAGRDTESCQFFITLAPAPHLDGRYTRFAHVVSGMEVVQKLVVGDAMTGVEPL